MNWMRLFSRSRVFASPLTNFGFSQSGKTLQQNMTTGEQSGNDIVDELCLAKEDLVQGSRKFLYGFGVRGDF